MNKDQRRHIELLIETFENRLLYWAEQEVNKQRNADKALNRAADVRLELGRYLDSLTETGEGGSVK